MVSVSGYVWYLSDGFALSLALSRSLVLPLFGNNCMCAYAIFSGANVNNMLFMGFNEMFSSLSHTNMRIMTCACGLHTRTPAQSIVAAVCDRQTYKFQLNTHSHMCVSIYLTIAILFLCCHIISRIIIVTYFEFLINRLAFSFRTHIFAFRASTCKMCRSTMLTHYI